MIHRVLVELAQEFVGVKESGGNNRGPLIEDFQRMVDGKAQGEPWCFEGSVEILTREGWTPFHALQDGAHVAQVSSEGKVTFVTPKHVVRKTYSGPGYHVTTRSLDFRVDVGHRFWGAFNNSASPRFGTLADVTHSLQIPHVSGSGGGCGLTPPEITLLAAFMAEGFLGTTRQGSPRIRIQVSKEREKAALEGMNPISTSTASRVYGTTTKVPLTIYGFEVPPTFEALFEDYKVLRWDVVFSFTPAEAALFLEHYARFDGNIKRQGSTSRRIFCSDLRQMDRLVALATLAGHIPALTTQRSGFPGGRDGYVMQYALGKLNRTLRKQHIKAIEIQDETLFCVEVPEGRILVRDKKGNPFVSGNCMTFVQFCVQATARRFGIAPTLPATEHCMTAWNNARTIHKFPPSDGVVAPGFIAIWKQIGSSNGHCGIVVDASHNLMHTVEGNTSDGSGINREGDGVYLRARNRVGMGKMVLVGFIDPFGGQ